MIATEAREKKWYTIKVQNSRERTVSERIKLEMIREYNQDINILIPIQNILSVKAGKKVQKEQVLYPGYIFVETSDIDKVEHMVKTTNGATNILKDKDGNPIALKQREVDRMIGEKEEAILAKTTKNIDVYLVGEAVVIAAGPFQSFKGTVTSFDGDKDKVKVEVMIFGRSTIVDLQTSDVNRDE